MGRFKNVKEAIEAKDFSAMDIRQLQQTLKNSGVILHERELNIGKL